MIIEEETSQPAYKISTQDEVSSRFPYPNLNYELFLMDENREESNLKEPEQEQFQKADWSKRNESEIEDVALRALDTIVKFAIRRITYHGYTEEIATNAVLRTGLSCGVEAMGLDNIVANALRLLECGQVVNCYLREDCCLRENLSKKLGEMEKSNLNEMVARLIKTAPTTIGRGEALYRFSWLLISDISFTRACKINSTILSFQIMPELYAETTSEFNAASSNEPGLLSNLGSSKQTTNTPSDCVIGDSSTSYASQSSLSKGKRSDGKICQLGSSKQSRLKIEPKATIREGKHTDDRCKAITDSNAIKMNNASMIISDATFNILFSNQPIQTTNNVDEMIQKFKIRVKELEAQLQQWSSWAEAEVKWTVHQLREVILPELQSLRHEKDAAARIEKDNRFLKDNAIKKLAEVESELAKKNDQLEEKNSVARDLKLCNIELQKEMEDAKLQAAESESRCDEVLKREMETPKKLESMKSQKAILQEELAIEEEKLSQLQQQLQQAKMHRAELEAMWKQEEKAKEDVLIQHNAERRERGQIEISARSKEKEMKLEEETLLQKRVVDIKDLERQIAEAKQRTNSFYTFSRFLNFMELEEDVKRNQECVMCLFNETSVLFLPCRHQVLCRKCNEVHLKQNLMDCPTCRRIVKERINIRSADF